MDGIFNICIGIFLRLLFWSVYIVRTIYSCLYYNCIVYMLYTVLYYIRGSHLCAAIVQFYRMYSLYYLVLCVSSDLCAVYLYYFYFLTQILRVLAAPTQLVPATISHSPPPLKSQWWRSFSGANGGAPVPAGANIGPSHPRPNNSPSGPSVSSIPSSH